MSKKATPPVQHAWPDLCRLGMRAQLCLLVAWVSAGVGLSGCANWPPEAHMSDERSACDRDLSPADNTRLAGIEQLIVEGKFYAALAQLDTLDAQAAKVRLVRAEALRRVDKLDEASAIYAGLLNTCHAGRAHHGLGLLLARQSDGPGSLRHLEAARKLIPTDGRLRGDLGYAYYLAGRPADARFELLTALDLNPQDGRSARNLVLLTLKQGGESKAQELANKLGLDKATMDRLRKQASESTVAPANPPETVTSAPSGT